jgi:phosphate transport system protein
MVHHTLTQVTEAIEEQVLQLAALVEEQIARSLQGMMHPLTTSTEQVTIWEVRVDQLRDEIQARIALALQQWAPLGSALRHLMALYVIVGECERIGDYAVHVARDLQGVLILPRALAGSIIEMAHLVRTQMHLALQVLVQVEATHIQALREGERHVDSLRREIVLALQVDMMAHPEQVPSLIPILFAVRDLERIGDRIINIGKDVEYGRTGHRALPLPLPEEQHHSE